MSPRPDRRPTATAAPKGVPKALVAGVLAAVVLLVVVVVLALTRPWADGEEGAAGAGEAGVSVGEPAEGAPEVILYEDFQCSWCARFDAAIGEEMHRLAQDGQIDLTYVVRHFLDGQGDTSTRASNAALCAEEEGEYVAFQSALYSTHPVFQGETGDQIAWTDEHFVSVAEQIGLSGADLDGFNACVAGQDHLDRVRDMEVRALRDGITGTPTIVVEGEQLDEGAMNGLLSGTLTVEQAVAEATS